MAAARVLIVDDEPSVLTLVERGLSRAGYEVLRASGGDEALRIFERAGSIDVLVSDCVMPGMSGAALAREVTRKSPSTAVILMSGYADGSELAGAAAFLRKPFTHTELLAVVQRVLARSAEARAQLREAVSQNGDLREQLHRAAGEVARLRRAAADNVERLRQEQAERRARDRKE